MTSDRARRYTSCSGQAPSPNRSATSSSMPDDTGPSPETMFTVMRGCAAANWARRGISQRVAKVGRVPTVNTPPPRSFAIT